MNARIAKKKKSVLHPMCRQLTIHFCFTSQCSSVFAVYVISMEIRSVPALRLRRIILISVTITCAHCVQPLYAYSGSTYARVTFPGNASQIVMAYRGSGLSLIAENTSLFSCALACASKYQRLLEWVVFPFLVVVLWANALSLIDDFVHTHLWSLELIITQGLALKLATHSTLLQPCQR